MRHASKGTQSSGFLSSAFNGRATTPPRRVAGKKHGKAAPKNASKGGGFFGFGGKAK